MKRPNPKHAQPLPLAGQQLPSNWKDKTADHGGTYDRRNLSEMWKQEPTHKQIQVDSLIRNARLQPLSWNEIYGEK